MTEEMKFLITHFYQNLVLLNVLDPLNSTKRSQRILRAEKKETLDSWHEFLDSICLLADYQCGGKTVTGIAVQKVDHGAKFWIATSQVKRGRTLRHIKWILKRLDQHCLQSSYAETLLSKRIALKSILLGRSKVKNYHRIMTINFLKAVTLSPQHLSEEGKENFDHQNGSRANSNQSNYPR